MATSRETITPGTNTKIVVTLLLGVILTSMALFLFLGRSLGLSANPGFLGTRASFFADLNLIAQFFILIGLSLGAVFAHKGNISAHQYTQTAMVMMNIVLTIFVMIASFEINVVPGLPGNLRYPFGQVSTIHALLGTLAIFCGVYILLVMNQFLPKQLRTRRWKALMIFTLILYWIVGILGAILYSIWYIL